MKESGILYVLATKPGMYGCRHYVTVSGSLVSGDIKDYFSGSQRLKFFSKPEHATKSRFFDPDYHIVVQIKIEISE
jgi:hypothetical protein